MAAHMPRLHWWVLHRYWEENDNGGRKQEQRLVSGQGPMNES